MTFVKMNHPAQKNMHSFFDELMQELPSILGKDIKTGQHLPAVNIVETKEAYHLELNAPGRNKEDFKIEAVKGLLTIGFEKKDAPIAENIKTIRNEFSLQSFKRSFNLDEAIDALAIQAKYENGILKLYLPKKEEVKEAARQISIL